MPYIVCNKKKKGNKVHVSVCERCKGMQCADYRNYMQLSLFPSFMKENLDSRRPFSRKKRDEKKVSQAPDTEQISLFEPGSGS